MPQVRFMPTHWGSTPRIQFICLSSVWWICMRFTTTIEDTSWQTCWKTYWYQLWHRHQAFIRRRRLCPKESLEGRISLSPFNQVYWAPTFRQTLICLINFRLEFAVLSTFFQVIVCCVEAHNTAKDAKLKNHEDYDPTAIWMLPFVFERLVLAPNPDNW